MRTLTTHTKPRKSKADERRAETKLPKPEQRAKEEFQYTRHGTVCVTGNWHVVRGQLIASTISETRDNYDFARHIERTIATDPTAGWIFVVDNLNTHCGEPLVRMVADQLGIDQATLGAVDYFNETIARPMNWTYTGRPTKQGPRTWRELRQIEKPEKTRSSWT